MCSYDNDCMVYLSSVELLLCLALGFTPIRLAVLLCWQVWIRWSTGVRISRPLSGKSDMILVTQCLITESHEDHPVMLRLLRLYYCCLFFHLLLPFSVCLSAGVHANMCLYSWTHSCVCIYNTMRCSPTPAIFWEAKYSTKEARASSSLLLGPNPFHHPPQCSIYTSFIPLFILQGHLLISKIYGGYHFSL